jgi:hypothetical protein
LIIVACLLLIIGMKVGIYYKIYLKIYWLNENLLGKGAVVQLCPTNFTYPFTTWVMYVWKKNL